MHERWKLQEQTPVARVERESICYLRPLRRIEVPRQGAQYSHPLVLGFSARIRRHPTQAGRDHFRQYQLWVQDALQFQIGEVRKKIQSR